MRFENIHDLDDALASSGLSLRDLYAAWEQRQPVAEIVTKKDSARRAADAGQIAWVQNDPALALRFTNRALEKEEFLLVCDAARETLRHWTGGSDQERICLVRIRMNYAEALTRIGCTRDARQLLEPCARDDFQPKLDDKVKAELFLQLGEILSEESHQATSRAAMLRSAGDALEFYQRSLQHDPERLDALARTAAALLILGEPGSRLREQTGETARQILEITGAVENINGVSIRTALARATAYAVLDNVDAAAQIYSKLPMLEGVATKDLADARHDARFLAGALGRPGDFFKPAFPPLQLIVFSGHLPDLPGQPARFPASSIQEARESIRAKLDQLDARVGLVSASAGADLLFFEAMRARHGAVHLILPWSRDDFRRMRVNPFDVAGTPPTWEPLFDRALEEAATVREMGQIHAPSTDVGWNYMMEVSAGLALGIARALRLDVQPLALWDGRAVAGAAGASSFVDFWRLQLQRETIRIDLPPVASAVDAGMEGKSTQRCEQATTHQRVKSMLFGDIIGYSKLSEKVIPEFVDGFLARVSQLASASRHPPCSIETWGDAIFAVFDFAEDAGKFALELTQMLHEGEKDWLQKGLYWEETNGPEKETRKRTLNIRIGLHTGPVFMHYNPVMRRLGYTGAHVTRAARIEPVARPGEVFASEEFAALAELAAEINRLAAGAAEHEQADGFVCEYAGSMQLAKNYPGRFRIHRLVASRSFAIEDLAKAAHADYVQKELAKGEMPATNGALRAWEELPEDLRDANRAQVADIPNKLRRLGYELAPAYGLSASEINLSPQQVEELSIIEHDRWMNDRLRHGWSYGPMRDNARKLHPQLVPWDQLSEPEKQKDRDAVKNLPRFIELAGFFVREI
jgi:class 3 adenylate cyclase